MRDPRRLGVGALSLLLAACASSELPPPSPPLPSDPFPVPAIDWQPRSYLCRRAPAPIVIDGRIEPSEWGSAPWTEPFVDIRGGDHPRPSLRTRARMLWDDEALYVAAELEEPHVWATLTERDSVIYHDDDFEVFVDPDGDTHEYYELEINALGTEWDLFLVRPYRDDGSALHAWDIPGLRTAVDVQGTLGEPADVDLGWTVEIALPWKVLAEAAHRPSPPEPGDRWRVNFSRVDWSMEVLDGGYRKRLDPDTGRPLPEDNWVWSPQGLVAMHYPEMWGFVEFAPEASRATAAAAPTAREAAAWSLRRVYYAQRRYREQHGRWAPDLETLGLDPAELGGQDWSLVVGEVAFEARVAIDGEPLRITADGRVW